MGRNRRKMDDIPDGNAALDMLNMLGGVTGPEPEAEEAGIEIALTHISVDPAQPRRAMPSHLRAAWLNGDSTANIFEEWLTAAMDQAPEIVGTWRQILTPPDDPRPYEDEGNGKALQLPPAADLWMHLVGLAADILTSGLQQRIAVYEELPGRYRVLFGERRFLSYNLLNWAGYKGFDEIPALVVEGYDALAQALENGARMDLNAIEKARQLAVLLIKMNPDKAGSYKGPQPTWAWYAQAADASRFRIARGKSDLITRALGLNSKQHISLYRQLLNAPAEVAEWADQYNWTERTMRRQREQAEAKGQPWLTIARIEMGLDSTPKPTDKEKTERLVQQVVGKLEGVSKMKLDGRLSKGQKQSVKAAIQDARSRLDEIENTL